MCQCVRETCLSLVEPCQASFKMSGLGIACKGSATSGALLFLATPGLNYRGAASPRTTGQGFEALTYGRFRGEVHSLSISPDSLEKARRQAFFNPKTCLSHAPVRPRHSRRAFRHFPALPFYARAAPSPPFLVRFHHAGRHPALADLDELLFPLALLDPYGFLPAHNVADDELFAAQVLSGSASGSDADNRDNRDECRSRAILTLPPTSGNASRRRAALPASTAVRVRQSGSTHEGDVNASERVCVCGLRAPTEPDGAVFCRQVLPFVKGPTCSPEKPAG